MKDQDVVVWQALPNGTFAEYTKLYADAQLRVLNGDVDGAAAAAELQSGTEALLESAGE